jgi:hypothetical protein
VVAGRTPNSSVNFGPESVVSRRILLHIPDVQVGYPVQTNKERGRVNTYCVTPSILNPKVFHSLLKISLSRTDT